MTEMQQPVLKSRRILIGIIIAVLVYLILVFAAGWDEILNGLRLITASQWILIFLLTFVHFAVRFFRWQHYLGALGHRLPLGRHILIYLSGFALTTTPGKVGEAWRAVYLRPFGVNYSHTISCFFAERYMDLIAIILLSLLASSLYTGTLWVVQIGSVLLLILLLLLRHPKLPPILQSLSDRHSLSWAQKIMLGLAKLLEATSILLSLRSISYGTILGIVSWAAQGLILYSILTLMGGSLPLSTAIGIYALGLLAGAVSFLPGGLGSTEAVIVLMLLKSGIDAPMAASVTLICRIATLWMAVALGCLSIPLLHQFSRSPST